MHAGGAVPKVETNTRRIVARRVAEGWRTVGGGGHDRYVHPDRPAEIIVFPRHRELTPGVARSIAKVAHPPTRAVPGGLIEIGSLWIVPDRVEGGRSASARVP